MNIKMSRVDDHTNILIVDKNGIETPFDYVSMIRFLYGEREMSDAEFIGDFLDEEKASITTMVSKISEIVSSKDGDVVLKELL